MLTSEKLISGGSFQIPEVPYDEQMPYNSLSNQYNMVSVIENIGHQNFKFVYKTFINEIKQYTIEDQRKFCYQILDTITVIYNYDAIINLEDPKNFEKVYEFIDFLELNSIAMLAKMWEFFKVDFFDISDFKEYLFKNFNKIEEFLKYIDDNINNEDFKFANNEIIYDFLRTYNKTDFLVFLARNTEKYRSEIILNSKGYRYIV